MNPSLLDHSMHHFPSSTYPEDRAEHPPSFLHDNRYNPSTPPTSSHSSGGSLISTLLQKTIESKQTLQESTAAYYHPDAHISFSALTSPSLVDHHSSTSSKSSSTTMEPLSPASQASTGASPTRVSPNGAGLNQDWTLELGDRRQAKRARVENIIRGMAVSPPSPSVHCTDEGETTPTSDLQSETMENKQENKRKQRVPQHQDLLRTGGASGKSTDEGHNLKKQLQTMQRLLGQLQARFIQVYEYQTESEEDVSDGTFSTGVMEDDHQSTWNKGYPETEVFMDPYSEFNNGGPLDRGHLGWKNYKLTDYIHSNPDKEDKLLADILKYELSRAVNSSEGLTTHHLKKAKLMFFYTRYPSSNVLTTFFSDVQLTRCIMSQLIKWFSNFREFYYIQMEKFARQARVDGVNSVRDVAVRRDSELFRALNMHYNKANDFQVPDRFLEVAEITLQEFYISISLARDSDPSWKKAIYKVISKLDSDVPAEFKAPLTT
uniref:Prospero homeobox 2 n=1 Tax=Hucho hucho TaxID=62062 RepID=A0A4W5MSG4_9TELE